MGWYGPQGGDCGCCPSFACEDCDALSYFAIAGATDPAGCPGGCTKYNATYVFRSGSQISECAWRACLAGDNCGGDDEPQLYIGERATALGGCGPSGFFCNNWLIEFVPDPGGVKINLYLEVDYTLESSLTVPHTYNSRRYQYKFSGVFFNCEAAIGGTLTLESVTKTTCQGSDTGDQCGLAGATVTLG